MVREDPSPTSPVFLSLWICLFHAAWVTQEGEHMCYYHLGLKHIECDDTNSVSTSASLRELSIVRSRLSE